MIFHAIIGVINQFANKIHFELRFSIDVINRVYTKLKYRILFLFQEPMRK